MCLILSAVPVGGGRSPLAFAMKNPLRRITIDDRVFLWRTGAGDPFLQGKDRWKEQFVAYLEGHKQSPLRICFEMGLCGQDGEIRKGDDGLLDFDLNVAAYWPRGAEHFIRYGLNAGWIPEDSARPFLIEDGSEAIRTLERA